MWQYVELECNDDVIERSSNDKELKFYQSRSIDCQLDASASTSVFAFCGRPGAPQNSRPVLYFGSKAPGTTQLTPTFVDGFVVCKAGAHRKTKRPAKQNTRPLLSENRPYRPQNCPRKCRCVLWSRVPFNQNTKLVASFVELRVSHKTQTLKYSH